MCWAIPRDTGDPLPGLKDIWKVRSGYPLNSWNKNYKKGSTSSRVQRLPPASHLEPWLKRMSELLGRKKKLVQVCFFPNGCVKGAPHLFGKSLLVLLYVLFLLIVFLFLFLFVPLEEDVSSYFQVKQSWPGTDLKGAPSPVVSQLYPGGEEAKLWCRGHHCSAHHNHCSAKSQSLCQIYHESKSYPQYKQLPTLYYIMKLSAINGRDLALQFFWCQSHNFIRNKHPMPYETPKVPASLCRFA